MRGLRRIAWGVAGAAALGCGTAAVAGTTEPEFQLSDVGVRVDLPGGWNMTRWSSFDLKAETGDPIVLQAWASEVQSDLTTLDPAAWKPLYEAKLTEMGAGDEGIVNTRAEKATVQGQPAVFVDYSFKIRKTGTPAVLKGATIAVEGQMFHLALVSVTRFDKKVASVRDDLMGRLEIQRGPAAVAWGPEVTGDGFTHDLPDDWRLPVPLENDAVSKQISKLGLERLDGCWVAMKPAGPALPTSMVACQGGLLLGVVDAYSFADAEEKVRAKMFGTADVAPARAVELADRVAFAYDLHDKGLAVGVVPYGKGVARVWVKGTPGDPTLITSLEAVLQAGTYEGTHPASLGDWVGYYLAYRPLSPVVVCPVLSVLVVGGLLVLGAGALMLRGAGKPVDEDGEAA